MQQKIIHITLSSSNHPKQHNDEISDHDVSSRTPYHELFFLTLKLRRFSENKLVHLELSEIRARELKWIAWTMTQIPKWSITLQLFASPYLWPNEGFLVINGWRRKCQIWFCNGSAEYMGICWKWNSAPLKPHSSKDLENRHQGKHPE